MQMLIKRWSTVSRSNGASGNGDVGGLQTEAARVIPSANRGYSYGFNVQTLYDNQLT